MSTQLEMQRLAALTWLGEKIAAEAKATKARIAGDIGTGGRAIAQVDGEPLGSLSAPKAAQPKPQIVDDELAMSWLIEEFGTTGMVHMAPTEQGKNSLVQAVLDGRDVPGMIVPAPRESSPRFTLSAEADDLIPAMLRAGVLSATDLLGIEAL